MQEKIFEVMLSVFLIWISEIRKTSGRHAMANEYKDRVCETRPVKQIKLNTDSIVPFQYTQLIQLAQWLYNQCHSTNTDSKTIIGKFFKKTADMRRVYE